MVTERGTGVEFIHARGDEARFSYGGAAMRLGVFSGPDGWYVGVHNSKAVLQARLSTEYTETLKEATDLLKYGFFLRVEDNPELINYLQDTGLLTVDRVWISEESE